MSQWPLSKPPAGLVDDKSVHQAPLPDWRRVDWRFILPEGASSVGYVGPVENAEIAVLRESGAAVVTDLRSAVPAGGVDVAIVTEPSARAVATAARAVRPGGWVLVRLGPLRLRPWSRIRRGGSTVSWRRLLEQRGLRSTRAYWHAPNEDRCSYLVALDDRIAVSAMLRRYAGVRLGLAKSVLARALHRAGLVAILGRDVTVVGRRPGTAEPDMTGVRADRSTLLLTPWFEASRHVVGLHFDLRTRALAEVSKQPRRPWDLAGISHEAASLALVGSQAPRLAGLAPEVLRLELGGRPMLAETAVRGRAVGPEVVRAKLDVVIDAGIGFVRLLPQAGRTDGSSAEFSRLLELPLHRVAELAPADSTVADMVARSLELLRPLRTVDLPLVFEHGDLGHPNLLLTDRDQLAAVDWERSEPRGLPGHDLCFFLQYVGESRRAAFDRWAQLRAFDEAFTGTDAWARPILLNHLAELGVDPRLLPLLVVASWARSAAGLVSRLAPASGDDSLDATDLLAALTEDRDFALWRHSLARYPDLAP